jgi:hypothetical protein
VKNVVEQVAILSVLIVPVFGHPARRLTLRVAADPA